MVPFKGPCLVRCLRNCRESRRGPAPPLPSHALNQNKPTQNSYINATFFAKSSRRFHQNVLIVKWQTAIQRKCRKIDNIILQITFEFKRISFTVSVCIGEILAKTLQTMMYAKLIQQRLWLCHASGLLETTLMMEPPNQSLSLQPGLPSMWKKFDN